MQWQCMHLHDRKNDFGMLAQLLIKLKLIIMSFQAIMWLTAGTIVMEHLMDTDRANHHNICRPRSNRSARTGLEGLTSLYAACERRDLDYRLNYRRLQ